MEKFRRNGGQGGWKSGNSFGAKKPWEGGGSDERGFSKPLFRATCAACGNACEVPFKPNGSKPVYCRDCFKKEGNGEPQRFDRMENRGFNAPEKRLYQATCDKCGASCEVPFRPTGERPVYCRACFGNGDAPGRSEHKHAPETRVVDYGIEQFKALNAKLDAILKLLAPAAKPEASTHVEEVAPKKAAKKKIAAKKK